MVDIEVYGEIGEDFFSPSNMTAAKFSKALKDAGGEDVTVHVNSPGGKNRGPCRIRRVLLRPHREQGCHGLVCPDDDSQPVHLLHRRR